MLKVRDLRAGYGKADVLHGVSFDAGWSPATHTGGIQTMMLYKLRLFVTGRTAQSQRAINNLRDICENEIQSAYEVEVIDVLEHPELAERDKILATPTLVKRLPEPMRKIIGDLSDREKVLLGLNLELLDKEAHP